MRKCDDPWDRDVPSLQTVIPLESAAAYDMLDVIREVDQDIYIYIYHFLLSRIDL